MGYAKNNFLEVSYENLKELTEGEKAFYYWDGQNRRIFYKLERILIVALNVAELSDVIDVLNTNGYEEVAKHNLPKLKHDEIGYVMLDVLDKQYFRTHSYFLDEEMGGMAFYYGTKPYLVPKTLIKYFEEVE